ncbi:MAG TPA: acetyl-CoA acetyltransferase [Acidimicrobiia bacterium]|nr:acetyl-CoA acetyltransferase [Acidimicrobiia bacterium]
MKRGIHVLGGYQTDFAENWSTAGRSAFEAMSEAVLGALDAASVDPGEVDAFEVGNFVGELFLGQGHLGGMVAAIHPALAGKPGARHEAACASGSVAALSAISRIEAGWSDVVVVVGLEQMRNIDAATAADHLGAAMWRGREGTDAVYPWVNQFSRIADAYAERWGLDDIHLGAIAEKNFDNARRNPRAQSRAWSFEPGAFGPDDDLNPIVEGRLRRQDCGRITDGAAAVVLCSGEFADRHARRTRRGAPAPRIAGWSTATAPMLLQTKLDASPDDGPMFPHLARVVDEARGMAEVGLDDIDLVETHDCFTISEYLAYDHLGLSEPGRAWEVVETGAATMDGHLPVNPSGGLIGAGHPVGATGVRMLHDAATQVDGSAGATQVPGARTAQTLNIGGSLTTVASFIVQS